MREEQGIEPSDAGEAAGEGHLDEGQRRLGEQLLGQEEPARLGELDGRDAEFLPDGAAELTRADAELAWRAFPGCRRR